MLPAYFAKYYNTFDVTGIFLLNYSRNSQLNCQKIGKLSKNAISTNAGEKDFIYTYYMGASDDKTDSFNSVLILSRLTPHLYSPICEGLLMVDTRLFIHLYLTYLVLHTMFYFLTKCIFFFNLFHLNL